MDLYMDTWVCVCTLADILSTHVVANRVIVHTYSYTSLPTFERSCVSKAISPVVVSCVYVCVCMRVCVC